MGTGTHWSLGSLTSGPPWQEGCRIAGLVEPWSPVYRRPDIPRLREDNGPAFHDHYSWGGAPLPELSVQECFLFPGRTGPPPRRPFCLRRLGWSLVLPGDFGKEMDLNVTRFFNRLCSETQRKSVQDFGLLRKAPPKGPPVKEGPKISSGTISGSFSGRVPKKILHSQEAEVGCQVGEDETRETSPLRSARLL
jgi:hypothetical protein